MVKREGERESWGGQHGEMGALARCVSGIIGLFAVGFLLYTLSSLSFKVSSVN